MGIIRARAELMLEAKANGVNFSSTLTLGRQKNNMTSRELKHLRKYYNIDSHALPEESLNYRSYADFFFTHYLGVNNLSVIDSSDYEKADIIHDMNNPIPESYHESFHVVIDGGTLEHVFNFPTAINNCMSMLKTGGSIFIFSMANNHCGHGFYQFSPELFFRVFEESNGFEIESVILLKHPFPGAELSKRQKCYQVSDPKLIGRRSSLVTSSPVGIMVHAKKIRSIPIFSIFPTQSDYKERWSKEGGNIISTRKNINKRSIISVIYSRLPLRLRLWISGRRQLLNFTLNSDKEFYRPF